MRIGCSAAILLPLLLNILLPRGAATHAASATARRLMQTPRPALVPAPAPAPATNGPPLASLGPQPAYSAMSIVVTLEIWGNGLLTFDIVQQETLLHVMNETILDAYSDELQLLKVEDILPLSGPGTVSLYNNRSQFSGSTADAPVAGRRLLRATRKLLQDPGRDAPLAQAGDSSNITNLPHLQLLVRVSVEPGQVDLLMDEIKGAVNGPMLPLMNARDLDVKFLTLSSMSVDFGSGNNESEEGSSALGGGAIAGIVIAALVIPAGVVFAVFLARRKSRQKSELESSQRKHTSSDSNFSLALAATSRENSPAYGESFHQLMLPGSRSISPGDSLSSSGGSGVGLNNNSTKPSKAMDPNMCMVPFEELQFSRVIGEGSFGRVFLGKWQETTVAIKILLSSGGPLPDDSWDVQDLSQLRDCTWSHHHLSQSPAQKLVQEELAREAGLMAKMRHPNIVMFLGAALDPPCMVTEFCARGSLLDVLHRARTNQVVQKELDWKRRLRLALDAAKGMNYLHTRQPPILHRDLKSANLLVDKHWQAKVADFNLSRVMQPSAAVSSLAATNPRWLPPEVLVGNNHGSPTDVYAFGIVLWELITWDIPWKEETPWQVVIAVVDHDQRPAIPSREAVLGGYPVAWQEYIALMQTCWGKDVEKRPTFDSIITSMRFLIDAEDAEQQFLERLSAGVPEVRNHASREQTEALPSQKKIFASPFIEMPPLPPLPPQPAAERSIVDINGSSAEGNELQKPKTDHQAV